MLNERKSTHTELNLFFQLFYAFLKAFIGVNQVLDHLARMNNRAMIPATTMLPNDFRSFE